MEDFKRYGMREYKAPLSLRIKNFFFTHPIMVAVFVAIIISLFMGGCEKAHAEGMNEQIQDYVYEYIDAHMFNYPADVIEQAMSECPYFAMYKIRLQNQYDMYYLELYSVPEIGMQWSNGSSYAATGGAYTGWDTYFHDNVYTSSWYSTVISKNALSDTSNTICYRFTSGLNSNQYLGGYKVYNMYNQSRVAEKFNVRYNYIGTHNTNGYYIKYGSDNGRREFTSFEYIASYGNVYIQNGIQSLGTYENSIEPITNNTPGFEVYKLDTKGGIYFHADFSSLISISPAVSNSSTFTCTVHLDDTEQVISLDSSSEYYQYDVRYMEAYYSFPIASLVTNYNTFENVWIDNVKVINTTSSPGGSASQTFVYIDPIIIQGEIPNLEPENISKVEEKGDTLEDMGIPYYSGEQLRDLYNDNLFNQWITEDEFYERIASLGGGRSVKLVGATDQNVYENNKDNTLEYLSNIADILTGTADIPGVGATMTVVYGVNSFFDTITAPRNNGQIDFNGAAEDYIRNNLYSSTYDIIVLQAYYDAEALQTNSQNLLYTPIKSIDDVHAGEPYAGQIFYVILTQRYIESLNLDGIGAVQKLLESDVYYVKATYNYLYNRLNDFEDKTLSGLSSIIGLDTDIVSKLNVLSVDVSNILEVLKKIFDSLGALHLTQLDTIDTKLQTIITNMGNSGGGDGFNEDDTVAEAIAYYKSHNDNGEPDASVWYDDKMSIWLAGKVHSWFQGSSALDNRTSLLSDVFNAMTSMYDAMKDEEYFFSTVQFYLELISGQMTPEDAGDPDYTYFNHFFDDDFDPDTYGGFSEVTYD